MKASLEVLAAAKQHEAAPAADDGSRPEEAEEEESDEETEEDVEADTDQMLEQLTSKLGLRANAHPRARSIEEEDAAADDDEVEDELQYRAERDRHGRIKGR